MLFYVKDRMTFKTKAVLEGISWKLVRSVWTDLSEIVAKDDPNVNAGDIIFNRDGWLGLISDLERDGKQLSLKIEKIERILGRKIAWPGWGKNQYAEWCLSYMVNTWYKNGRFATLADEDAVYAMPYLTANRVTLDAVGAVPVFDDNGLVSGMSYISQIRRNKNVFTTFGVTANNELEVTIEHKTQTQKTLITTNYPCVVKEESFSEIKVAKVTTYTAILTSPPPAVDNVTDWYLFTDGTIGNDPTAGTREEGDWIAVLVDDYNDAETVAQNEFNKNAYSHKLIIQMQEKDARFDFYDLVRVEVGKHIYDSYVSRKTVTSDGLVEYTFGDLKTSLMDKINEYD